MGRAACALLEPVCSRCSRAEDRERVEEEKQKGPSSRMSGGAMHERTGPDAVHVTETYLVSRL